MSVLFFLLLFVPLSLVLAWWVAERSDRALLISQTAVAWIVLAPLTAAVNALMPFTGGGDDEGYYELAQPPPTTLAEALDLNRFEGLIDQPGYVWLLSVMNAGLGHDLLAYKLLNLFFLTALSIVWYRIGISLESRAFAKAVSLAVLALTPLWFYVFVLRKDILIALLQSLFLLGIIQSWRRIQLAALLIMVAASIGVVVLRSALLVQQAGVLVGFSLAQQWFGKCQRGNAFLPATVLIFAGLAMTLAANRTFLGTLGIKSESRLVSAEMFANAGEFERIGVAGTAAFPILYLLTETAGLNPSSWNQLDSSWLRGTLALPWILLVVPNFVLGLRHLISNSRGPSLVPRQAWYSIASLRRSKALSTPWCAVLLFVGSYFAVSLVVGDTTRWRVPEMAMTAAIATAGWIHTKPVTRNRLITWWMLSIGLIASCVHLFRGT